MSFPTYTTPEPVVLDGFQAVLKPTEYGYRLEARIPSDIIQQLEADRVGLLEGQLNRIPEKKQKRATIKVAPWVELDDGEFKLGFGWKATNKPVIVDANGVAVTNELLKVYSGSLVKLHFYQKGFSLPDSSYGTSVKLLAVQLIKIGDGSPSATTESAASVFGTAAGGFSVEDEFEEDGLPNSSDEEF